MRRATSALAVATALLSLSLVPPAAANAPENPFTADALPSWQTNGTVWAMAAAGDRVFAGGTFTQVRPPGTSAGDAASLARANLVALDAATGIPSDCRLDVSLSTSTPTVRSLAASPDGSTLYLGGSFSHVNGVRRANVAAVDAQTCELLAFNPGANSFVYAITSTASAVYLGGYFSALGGQARTRLGAVTPAGAVLPWAPTAEDTVLALAVDPGTGNVVIGGRMDQVNGQDSHALAVVDGDTGLTNVRSFPQPFFPYTPGQGQRPGNSAIKAIATDETGFYVGSEGTGSGVFDGRAAFDWDTYDQRWRSSCYGATQALVAYEGVLFSGNHAHNCEPEGLFEDGVRHYLNAEGTTDKAPLPWWPNTNGGTGESVGPRAVTVATSESAEGEGTNHLWYGGEFTTVNGVRQQGLTRFGQGPDTKAPATPQTPNVSSTTAGQVRVMVRTSHDDDDASLTYFLYRGTSTTPVAELTQASQFYDHPQVVFTDTDLTPGSNQSYRVRVSDGTNLSGWSGTRTVTVASSDDAYAQEVLADGAEVFFRMDETSGSAAGNDGAGPMAGSYVGGSSRTGQPGAPVSSAGTSTLFDGSTGFLRTDTREAGPSTYSVELWFRSTTTTGGRLIGFGNKSLNNGPVASPHSYLLDRHLYLGPDGRMRFGTFGASPRTLNSRMAYNDGNWHHVVGTQDASGMTLYVDGVRLTGNNAGTAWDFRGYWRVGGDGGMGNVWPSRPTTGFFAGQIDEAAIYPVALTSEQVARHYALSVPSAPR